MSIPSIIISMQNTSCCLCSSLVAWSAEEKRRKARSERGEPRSESFQSVRTTSNKVFYHSVMILTTRWVGTELFFVASFSEISRKVLIWCLRLKQFYLTSPCLLWPRDFLYQDCHVWCKPVVKIIFDHPRQSTQDQNQRSSQSNFFTILTIIHEQEQQYPPYSNCHHYLPPSILVLIINQSRAQNLKKVTRGAVMVEPDKRTGKNKTK